MSTPESLTIHLQSLSTICPYSSATEHDFLVAAGTGQLSKDLVSLYLSQDRLYAAHAYPRFIGQLLAAIPFSSLHAIDSVQELHNRRILNILSYSLQNVVREVGFFGEVAAKHGLKLDGWRERKATRDYTATMAAVGSSGSLDDGLIFLWAMEKVYLDSWKHVRSLLGTSTETSPTTAVIQEFVDNWTNPEFERFVNNLGDLVNSLDIKPDSEAYSRAEEIWARVVELEKDFWPSGEGELAILRIQ
ncbi:hypothetical protein PHLCEN_2v13539 [Hermanssonia centrifuga]|uniref:Thiaminase-2/PQQC domain-containing protein n=1 Tax=Hermanssonia centrifuga TaxID=98765 RepID=A0A2R6NE95_9APHY|nr:hypothetical protein PHLCEN_2v13539 [Hermanssonia centrifuga]